MRQTILSILLAVSFLGGCTRNLSPESQAQVQALRAELESTKKEVSAAEAQRARQSGGLLDTLVAIRLEILKTNAALIEQRIHAIESGAKVTVEIVATKVDLERAKQLEAELAKQELKVSEAERKASASSGGLIGAMAMMSTATERNTLAILRQQYLVARFGLGPLPLGAAPPTIMVPGQPATRAVAEGVSGLEVPSAQTAATPTAGESKELREQILEVTLLRKRYVKQGYSDFVSFDITFNATGLDKPARAVKGVMLFTDLFGEEKFGLRWTLEKPIAPGASYTEVGSGFDYNKFMDSHQWVRHTAMEDMKVKFRVDHILYQDGTKRDLD